MSSTSSSFVYIKGPPEATTSDDPTSTPDVASIASSTHTEPAPTEAVASTSAPTGSTSPPVPGRVEEVAINMAERQLVVVAALPGPTEGSAGAVCPIHGASPRSSRQQQQQQQQCCVFLHRVSENRLVRWLVNVYDRARSIALIGFTIHVIEGSTRLVGYPVYFVVRNLYDKCRTPVDCADRCACRCLDTAEAVVPCVTGPQQPGPVAYIHSRPPAPRSTSSSQESFKSVLFH